MIIVHISTISKVSYSLLKQEASGVLGFLVMTAILDVEPSESELTQLMKTIDTDRSGTVEWSEFLEAMTNWFVFIVLFSPQHHTVPLASD